MVVAQWDLTTASGQFYIRPNRSLSWHGTLRVYAVVCIFSSTLAIGLLVLGAWLVLPFIGMEVIALGVCLYHCACKTSCYECLTFNDDELVISRGRRKEHERLCLKRYWARVRLESPHHRWYASRLKIVSHGREVEIGRWLSGEEREKLASSLRQHLGGTSATA